MFDSEVLLMGEIKCLLFSGFKVLMKCYPATWNRSGNTCIGGTW